MFDESFVPICQIAGVGEFVGQLLGVAVDDGGDSVDLLPCLNTPGLVTNSILFC